MELGPLAAQVIGIRLWRVAVWSVSSPQRALDECRLMASEKQAALLETQLRAAWLPWLLGMRAVLLPMQAGSSVGAILSEALIHPSRRRVRANMTRLHRVR